MAADVGTGATFSLAGSPTNFFASLLSIEHSGVERPSIDVTTLATTGGREFIPGDLVDWGSLALGLLVEPAMLPPMLIAAGSAVITFPDGSTWTWTGFATGWQVTNALEERIEGQLDVKLSGDLAIV